MSKVSVRQDSLRTIRFADDNVISSETREQVEENLERWRCDLDKRRLKAAAGVNTCQKIRSGTVRLQGNRDKEDSQ